MWELAARFMWLEGAYVTKKMSNADPTNKLGVNLGAPES
jgi:hypothetical protein